MKTSTLTITYTTVTALAIASYFSISSISISSEPLTPHPTRSGINLNQSLPPIESIDIDRLLLMQKLLKSTDKNSYRDYRNLCLQATSKPRIGMTSDQARNSTWCFPYDRNITTTQSGEFVQETYLTPGYNNEVDSRYSPRRYLYFTNGILTSIQE